LAYGLIGLVNILLTAIVIVVCCVPWCGLRAYVRGLA